MSKFFDLFPKVLYDSGGKFLTNYEEVTNILFRFSILREVLSNTSAYYEYIIKDGDTPEILADKFYDDAEAHWIILMANEIVDPMTEWPKDYNSFNKFITKKYGSIATAKTRIHHYEKVITRTEELTGIVTETRFIINEDKLTNNELTVPHDYYDNLPEEQEVETFNIAGKTVTQITRREEVSCYDYEDRLNEKRRSIRIVKNIYYGQIMEELNRMTNFARNPFIRRLT